MPKISIDKDRCKGCLLCVNFCPQGLIKIDKELNQQGIKPARFSRQSDLSDGGILPKAGKQGSECIACSFCAIICPDCCIEVYR